ncbi:hypothetical protein DH2020_029194 [Rehmannia glutinosa]|uniref:Uncharacterized protein n=1 Tax=Rehmannia glutinosa TaxID=99300 RepID=A0ABR0VQ29_REHGL
MGRNSISAAESAVDDAAAAFHSIRDRFAFKRNNSYSATAAFSRSQRRPLLAQNIPISPPPQAEALLSSITSVIRQGVGGDRMRWRWSLNEGLKLGSSLEFVPVRRLELDGSRLDWLRSQPRIGVRPRESV